MMDTQPQGRWQPWRRGRVVLHLTSGDSVWFDGAVRLRETKTEATDYEVNAPTIAMIPTFSDVLAIEVR